MKYRYSILVSLFISINITNAQQSKTVVFKIRKPIVKESITKQVSSKEEPAFIVVEENATFNGGDLGIFRNWIQSKLIYPPNAMENNREGRVFIQFSIDSNGNIDDIKILRSSGTPELDEEAVRVMKTSPQWNPARQSGAPVKQQFTIPINFSMLK